MVSRSRSRASRGRRASRASRASRGSRGSRGSRVRRSSVRMGCRTVLYAGRKISNM